MLSTAGKFGIKIIPDPYALIQDPGVGLTAVVVVAARPRASLRRLQVLPRIATHRGDVRGTEMFRVLMQPLHKLQL